MIFIFPDFLPEHPECYDFRLAPHTQNDAFVVVVRILLCTPRWPQAHCVTQAGLETVAILLFSLLCAVFIKCEPSSSIK